MLYMNCRSIIGTPQKSPSMQLSLPQLMSSIQRYALGVWQFVMFVMYSPVTHENVAPNPCSSTVMGLHAR